MESGSGYGKSEFFYLELSMERKPKRRQDVHICELRYCATRPGSNSYKSPDAAYCINRFQPESRDS